MTATIPATTARGTGTPVLTVIQNDPTVPLDRFGSWLGGVDLRVVRAWEEDVPGADEAGAGVLVLSGPMSVRSAEHTWLGDVRRLLLGAVTTDVPVLAICLGHQLLAQALGGRVQVAAPPGPETGVVDITWRPEAAADPVLAAAAAAGTLVPSMHDDAVVELPRGAVWLAHSATYPFQAMRAGSALGVQFHPEASPELLAGWAAAHGGDAAAVLTEARAHDAEVAAVGRALAEGFAARVRRFARV